MMYNVNVNLVEFSFNIQIVVLNFYHKLSRTWVLSNGLFLI